jgi:hypothetical protein
MMGVLCPSVIHMHECVCRQSVHAISARPASILHNERSTPSSTASTLHTTAILRGCIGPIHTRQSSRETPRTLCEYTRAGIYAINLIQFICAPTNMLVLSPPDYPISSILLSMIECRCLLDHSILCYHINYSMRMNHDLRQMILTYLLDSMMLSNCKQLFPFEYSCLCYCLKRTQR